MLGADAPVRLQTMTKAPAHDAAALASEIRAAADLGADLVRLAVPDDEAARVLGEVRRTAPVPIVADIHFDHRLALAALAAGADAVRLNPGNLGGGAAGLAAVARAAKARGAAIRVGVNAGSLARGETLVSSALKGIAALEAEGFRDIVVSVKASDAMTTVAATRELAAATDCPIHLGVTEAGTLLPGAVRSSVALALLLDEGIGDTLRVSLAARSEQEVRVGMEILRTFGLRAPGPAVVACPTCGRTRVDLRHVASQVEIALETLARDGVRLPKVAVMGCAVNGPGEAQGADIALCGGVGEFVLYVKGVPVGKVSEAEAVGKVVEYALHRQ